LFVKKTIFAVHLLVGVPLAAFFHSVLQFLYEPPPIRTGIWLFPAHFLLGIIVGSIILAPAYGVQALVFLLLSASHVPRSLVVLICGLFQAGVVAVWAATVGIQPSLAGRFPLTAPMIAAGFLAGALVAAVAFRRTRPKQNDHLKAPDHST
jgi:hypothetical protein